MLKIFEEFRKRERRGGARGEARVKDVDVVVASMLHRDPATLELFSNVYTERGVERERIPHSSRFAIPHVQRVLLWLVVILLHATTIEGREAQRVRRIGNDCRGSLQKLVESTENFN